MSIVPGQHVLHRRRAAAIEHELELGLGLLAEIEAADVRAAAGADARRRRLVRIGLQPGDQLLGVLGRQRLLADDHQRRHREPDDRLEIVHRIPRHRIERRRADVARPVADAERVAVGRRADHAADADGGARAGHGLDQDRLAERLLHVLAHDPRDRVGRPARRERHDQRDRLRRIGFGLRAGQARNAQRPAQQQRSRNSHGFSPVSVSPATNNDRARGA